MFTVLQEINYLESIRSYKTTVNLENLKFKRSIYVVGFKMFTRLLARMPQDILINSLFLAIG